MFGIILILSILALGIYVNYKVVKYRKIKTEILGVYNTLMNFDKQIRDKVESKKGETYYKVLEESYRSIGNRVNNIDMKFNMNTLKCVNNMLVLVDNYNMYLNKNLNKIDEFQEFANNFANIKRKYRNDFNKSITILENISDKYGESVLKHINEFNEDYDSYKQNEILKLNDHVNMCKIYVKAFDIKRLSDHYNKITLINNELNIKLNEPVRLLERLTVSEESLEQLETELDNKQGTLYYKVFNTIKKYKVTQEEVYEWNSIKRKINYYKKNRLMRSDILKLNKYLIQIIDSMMNLSDKIVMNIKVVESETIAKKNNIIHN